jgi:hypothetical protein
MRQYIPPPPGLCNGCAKPFPRITSIRFIIHDHDAIFSAELNASLTHLGLKVITTPVHSPQANSLC